MHYKMRSLTLRNTKFNDKPNEDFCLVDEAAGAALLLDGVSRDRQNGCYPQPSPSCAADEAFAGAAFPAMLKCSDETASVRLLRAAKLGNQAVKFLNEDFPSYFLPGTVGILALLSKEKLDYLYIGDCNGAVLNEDGLCYFTEVQTAAVHARRGEFTSREIREHICNNAYHECGYGVWNGQDGAEAFMRTGSVSLGAGERVLIFSDGFDALFDGIDAVTLYNMSDDAIFERAGCCFNEKGMDDRTLIVITPLGK